MKKKTILIKHYINNHGSFNGETNKLKECSRLIKHQEYNMLYFLTMNYK